LKNLLQPDAFVEEIEEGIFSAIAGNHRDSEYDEKAGFYDAVIGNPLYNRVLWGNKLSDYQNFCRAALASKPTGYVLDVGCGSLVFTSKVYTQYQERPLILVDRSLGMLRRAQVRLRNETGKTPENITLLQSDLFALPFRAGVFETVLSFGMLHIFSDTHRLFCR